MTTANIVAIDFIDPGAQGEYGPFGKVIARSDVRGFTAEEREAEVESVKADLGDHVIAVEVEEIPAVKQSNSGLSFSYALAIQHAMRKTWDGPTPSTFSGVKTLHRGCANEAAYWTFETSEGETYVVEVQRRA